MVSKDLKVCVIGGGWYGCHIALCLKKRGVKVTVLEKDSSIFNGASGYNQNRLHQGFHYPRCKRTRLQSKRGFHLFRKHYEPLLIELDYNLYGIPFNSSLIDFDTYKDIMVATGLNFEDVSAVCPFPLKNINGVIDCEEAVINPTLAKTYFESELKEEIIVNHEVDKKTFRDLSNKYDYVIDCTWGGLSKREHRYYESCIYFIAQSKNYYKMGLTLMDGSFFSIYPLNEKEHTVTHVEHTPMKVFDNQKEAYEFNSECSKDNQLIMRKQLEFTKSIEEYYPKFSNDFDINDVRFAVKTKDRSGQDSRYVTIEKEDNILRVNSGKIDTVFDAESLIMSEVFS